MPACEKALAKKAVTLVAALLLGATLLPRGACAQSQDIVGLEFGSSEPSDAVEGDEAAETEPEDAALQSAEARELANWVIASGDNGTMPFVIIDKVAAAVFAYDAAGQPKGATAALLGIAHGDDASPGVGDRPLAEIGPAERTTPAGRFVANLGQAFGDQTVLWVDYADSVALHAVVTTNQKERRLERLQSPTADDNRITFGCINVAPEYFETVIQPMFTETQGVVYILPEKRFMIEVFPTFDAQQSAEQLSQSDR